MRLIFAMLSGFTNKLPVNIMPAPSWTTLGAAKLIPPRSHQLPTHAVESRQFETKDVPLIASAAKDDFFGGVSGKRLGPVEKAVLHQAMYNQSKEQSPEMRRCDYCNVIFNSQNQAEMHYKGKKHAKVMCLKRSRETKLTPQKLRSATYLCDTASYVVPPSTFPDSRSNSQVSATNETGILPDPEISCIFSAPSVDLKNDSTQITSANKCSNDRVAQCEVSSSGTETNPTESAFPELSSNVNNNKNNNNADQEATQEADASPLSNGVEDDKTKSSHVAPQREPVVLPDPLPRYISRIEKPSTLKESLRCTVCDIYVNSENQMRQHVNSLRHKNIEKGIPTPPKPIKEDKPKGRAEQFRCEICRVTLNSDIQLLQHLSSQRHKNMLEGKPPKPRWTPYERTQHALLRSAAQLRLSLKTVPGGSSPLLLASSLPNSATTLPMISHPAALRPPVQAPTHLKQMAYIAPNGGILQTREVVYIGAPAFPRTQHTHQLSTPGQILQSPLSGVHRELAHLINPACVGLNPHTFNWNP